MAELHGPGIEIQESIPPSSVPSVDLADFAKPGYDARATMAPLIFSGTSCRWFRSARRRYGHGGPTESGA